MGIGSKDGAKGHRTLRWKIRKVTVCIGIVKSALPPLAISRLPCRVSSFTGLSYFPFLDKFLCLVLEGSLDFDNQQMACYQ